MSAKVVVLTWALFTALAIWRFIDRYQIPVAPSSATGSASFQQLESDFKLKDSGQRAWLINFWNPDCQCSEFAEPHVQHLADKYGPRGFGVITVIVAEHDTQEQSALARARDRRLPGTWIVDRGVLCKRYGIKAAPAAMIFDRSGKIIYRGAYNISRFCSSNDTAYAEKALAATASGKESRVPNLPYYGCAVTY